MAQSIRNTPFEPRPQPKRKRKNARQQSTLGDRLVCAFCGAVLAIVV